MKRKKWTVRENDASEINATASNRFLVVSDSCIRGIKGTIGYFSYRPHANLCAAAQEMYDALCKLTYLEELMDKGVNVDVDEWDIALKDAKKAIKKAKQ